MTTLCRRKRAMIQTSARPKFFVDQSSHLHVGSPKDAVFVRPKLGRRPSMSRISRRRGRELFRRRMVIEFVTRTAFECRQQQQQPTTLATNLVEFILLTTLPSLTHSLDSLHLRNARRWRGARSFQGGILALLSNFVRDIRAAYFFYSFIWSMSRKWAALSGGNTPANQDASSGSAFHRKDM